MAIFRFFQDGVHRQSAAILDFLNVKFLTVDGSRGTNFVAMPNLVEIDQTVATAKIWQFFDFSMMAAVRHLGLIVRVFGPPT